MTKKAVVTGANRGIGLEVCRQLRDLGIEVLLTARDPERAKASASQLGGESSKVFPWPVEVTDQKQVDALKSHLQERWGAIDILVNNAGVFMDPRDRADSGIGTALEADLDIVKQTFEINTLGPLRLCRALIPLMKKNGGNIVNVSSGLGQLSDMGGGYPGYRISKTALNAVTCVLAAELRHSSIKINSVCPGWVRTDMGGSSAQRSVEQGAQGVVWAATLDAKGPSGQFFRDSKAIDW